MSLDPDSVRQALLTPKEAGAMDAFGGTDAGVLVPIYDLDSRPGLVFTERRADLRRHAGEISFPGGRPEPGEELLECALREAHEEVDLDPGEVEPLGALPPVSTIVTGYRIHPFVGLIHAELDLRANPGEVETVLHMRLDELLAGYGMRRLVRRGVPIRTPTYLVGEHMIWGATARILGGLLERLGSPPDR
jgi:8-oxo-dGTP pyrophosphatase MutT (NUDIX family)